MPKKISETLRKDYIGEMVYKTCSNCKQTHPRTPEFFYRKDHQSNKNYYRYECFCIKCSISYVSDWVKKNPEKRRKTEKLYIESENGYFKGFWANIKRSKHGNEFQTFEEFLNCWKDQQKIYGKKCPYTGVEMTMERFKSIDNKIIRTNSNISVDRILSTQPYSPRNLMFISWGANYKKGHINTNIAKKFLQFVRERYNTDEVE